MLPASLRVRPTTTATDRAREKSRIDFPIDLGRLREYFADPLLVRHGREMRPSHNAHQLMRPLRQATAQLDQAIAADDPFDPATSTRTFRIATTDYITFVLLPQLLTYSLTNAPGIKLAVMELDPANPLEGVHSGEVDLLIGAPHTMTPYLHEATLFTDHPRLYRT